MLRWTVSRSARDSHNSSGWCRLEIESLAVHQGRTRQVWEVRITRPDDGKLVARGQLRLQHITVRD